jgi:hypothetical protein
MYPLPKRLSEPERRWLALYDVLGVEDRCTLLAFGEFLAARAPTEVSVPLAIAEPIPLVRPETETVVGAIKRLSQSYRMLDRAALLHETSALVSAHVLQGRAAAAVIDDLEALFRDHYRRYRSERSA